MSPKKKINNRKLFAFKTKLPSPHPLKKKKKASLETLQECLQSHKTHNLRNRKGLGPGTDDDYIKHGGRHMPD